jgi:chemotaxis protein methyltransferase CheR
VTLQQTASLRVPGSPASIVPPSLPRDDFEPFCHAVRAICGVDLLQYKRAQMERRIRSWTARRGSEDLAEYGRRLKTDADELDAFLDRVTINVSQLWRNPEQWTVIADKLLPDLATDGNRVRCWSAGSSYGAEAYTLAAVARRSVPRATVSVMGTDIDMRMVERARRGVFSLEDARDAPADAIKGHFTLTDGAWHAGPEIKRLVRFEQGDLLRVEPRAASFDLVLCRNTVIYFNEDVRDALHERLVHSLRPGGVLMIGSTERVTKPRELGLEPTHPFVYRKS